MSTRILALARIGCCALWAATCLAGCARNQATRPPTTIRPTAPAQETSETIGRSVNGVPIEMRTFGSGERPVLVMGAIHGEESSTAVVTRQLVVALQRDASLASGVPVAVIEVANPDGLAAGVRFNAHKVDLNRNFPAGNFSRNARRGQAPLSEPESKALFDTIERLRPRLIISVHSMSDPCNNYDGPAKEVAERMNKLNGYPALANIGYPTPGSLGSWAGGDRGIPVITLELPRKLNGDAAWAANREALFAAIRCLP